MKIISVLMSTYNGEKFLRKQLESILNQKNVQVQIFVRDDGSTDKTVEILEEYQSNGLINFTKGSNIGYARSFLSLAKIAVSSAEYYAFSDQDDFWTDEKLTNAIDILEEEKNNNKLYFSNLVVVDAHLNKIGMKDFSDNILTLGASMVRTNAAGCTMVFDNKLLETVLLNENLEVLPYTHDNWFYKVCLATDGKVIFDPNSYILYRQHQSNVTGINQGLKKRILKELSFFSNRRKHNSNSAKILINIYSENISEENMELLNLIKVYDEKWRNTLRLLFNKNLKVKNPFINLLNTFKILTRKY